MLPDGLQMRLTNCGVRRLLLDVTVPEALASRCTWIHHLDLKQSNCDPRAYHLDVPGADNMCPRLAETRADCVLNLDVVTGTNGRVAARLRYRIGLAELINP